MYVFYLHENAQKTNNTICTRDREHVSFNIINTRVVRYNNARV